MTAQQRRAKNAPVPIREGAIAHAHLPADDEELRSPLLVRKRELPEEQWKRFEGYIAEMFGAFGLDLDTPGTRDTPKRFVRAIFDATDGYEGDPKLLTAFPTECKGGPSCHVDQIVEGPIHFFALCEHHALPFYGQAYVGYIAHDQIIGISKLTRLVRVFSRRFTVQERLGEEVADALSRLVNAHGVAVHMEAHHLCTQMRGVRAVNPKTRTLTWRGFYAEDAELRKEFFHLTGSRSD
ncbi:MAG: GTP cyclohydrolase I [Chloroflexota bacterium]|nr:GTP cyclohydrolase I [Chloroflexota bacterium]MDE3192922.1 GTP cyclohydrolase I [Chloroflexota bacterium]